MTAPSQPARAVDSEVADLPELVPWSGRERAVVEAREHLARMAKDNPERLAMLRAEWSDDDDQS